MPDKKKTDFFALERAIINYEGKDPKDTTFQEATKRAATTLTDEEKELLRQGWNQRMKEYHAEQLKLRKRVHNRRARRALNSRL